MKLKLITLLVGFLRFSLPTFPQSANPAPAPGHHHSALEHLRNCLTYFPPGPDLEQVKQQIAQIQPAVQSKLDAPERL
jgi:hypothetical protein